jgi:hypothetical protein
MSYNIGLLTKNFNQMETPEEFLKHYHNNLLDDWLYEKREVVARLIKEYTDQALRIHDVVGRSEQLNAFVRWVKANDRHIVDGDFSLIDDYLKSL